jgi:hypothetical protein
MTLIDDYIVDCQLRGIRYPKTAIYYIQDFATTCEDLQNANRADLKRYLAVLRGRNLKQSSIMKAYNHLSGFYEYLVDEELITVSYPSPEGEGLSAALSRSVSESEICPDLQASLHASTICRGPSLAGTLASDLPKTASNRVSTAPFRARVWQSRTGSASNGLPLGCL